MIIFKTRKEVVKASADGKNEAEQELEELSTSECTSIIDVLHAPPDVLDASEKLLLLAASST